MDPPGTVVSRFAASVRCDGDETDHSNGEEKVPMNASMCAGRWVIELFELFCTGVVFLVPPYERSYVAE